MPHSLTRWTGSEWQLLAQIGTVKLTVTGVCSYPMLFHAEFCSKFPICSCLWVKTSWTQRQDSENSGSSHLNSLGSGVSSVKGT